MISNKNLIIIFLISLSITALFFIFNNSEITKTIEKILFFLLLEKEDNYITFISLLFFLNFFYFLTPLPVTPIILFNGFALGYWGFLFTIIIKCICSILIFLFSKIVLKKNLSDISHFKYLKLNLNKYKFIKMVNNFSIFLSRFIIPYFFHNIFFGLFNLTLKRFFLIILAADIPGVFAFNSMGMSLTNFILTKNYKISDLILNFHFILPLLFVLLIILFSGTIKRTIINRFN
tara:strand:- start:600 stop:1298 length:699 start_codon:yes stop_codon:yes gene_type:complete